MSVVRRSLKEALAFILGAPLATRVLTAPRARSRIILAYHNVVPGQTPPRDGDRSLHLPLAAFRAQLDALERAGIAVRTLASSFGEPGSSPSVVITFDDAYAHALDLAIPELARRGMPATMFVAPGLLSATAPWWDRLADPAVGSVPEPTRTRVLQEYRGEGVDALAAAERERWIVHPASGEHRIGSDAELHTAVARHPGLTLGNHTWSHPNLAAVADSDGPAAVEQLRRTSNWLDERFGERAIPYLAYPYGMESARARQAAAAAGMVGALRVSGGWDGGRGDRLAIPRFNVTPGLSRRGFMFRLAIPSR